MSFGLPGPLEMLVILVMGLVCIGVPIVILVVVFGAARRSHSAVPESPPCPQCGTHVVPGAKFCHQCGSALGPPQQPPGHA